MRALAQILATVLLVAGGLLLTSPLIWIGYTALYVGPTQTAALAAWEKETTVGAHRSANRSDLVLTIPRLGFRRYVPEGASQTQLRRYGVGRISWTGLPDRAGIVGIAGHRTTYGAPFFRLNKLVKGDLIFIDYAGKRYAYRVSDRHVVRPGEVEVLRGPPGLQGIALVTCTPVYSAAYRLVILGNLQNVSLVSSSP